MLLPVCPADILSAVPENSAGCKPAARTDCKSMFRFSARSELSQSSARAEFLEFIGSAIGPI